MILNNPFINTRIEFHILQSFPVTCLNRDDVGAPKTAIVGGSSRARVSSQCWKRQVRLAMREFGVKLANRTKLIDKCISQACLKEGATKEQAAILGSLVSNELSGEGDGDDKRGATLLFLSSSEVDAFAKQMKHYDFSFEKLDSDIKALELTVKELKAKRKKKADDFDPKHLSDKEGELKIIKSTRDIPAMFKEGFSPSIDGIDIALFGRMVAKATTMNVEAAASFSHAISTHKVSNEVEFFTALDDLQEEPGSAHLGSLEFNSATYYRYISLDLGQLCQTLADQNLENAVEAFTKALFVAVPNARQSTQSGASHWEFAKVFIRNGQRLQVPFETAVRAINGGFLQPSIRELKEYLAKKQQMAGSLFGKIAEFTLGEDGDDFNIDHLITALKQYVIKAVV